MDFSLTDEQRAMAEAFGEFCAKELSDPYVRWMDANLDFPPEELWDKFAALGLFGVTVPTEYGGLGLGVTDEMVIYEQVCKRSMSVALALGATFGFGTRFVAELGTDEQKAEYLPRLAEGRLRTAMALTEPGGGTDILGSVCTFAEDAGDSWVINGNKIFITGAHVADLIFTVCRTERDARRSQSWSTIMVPRPSEGMTMHPAGEDQLPSLRQRRDQLRRRRGAQGEPGRNPRAGIPRDHDRAQPRAHRRGDDHINLENARNHTYKAAWLCDTGRPSISRQRWPSWSPRTARATRRRTDRRFSAATASATNTRCRCSRATLTRSSSRPSPTR